MKFKIVISIIMVGITGCCAFQSDKEKFAASSDNQLLDEEHQKVFQELRILDSLLFELGFNQCDTAEVKKLTSDDFEFYHDQAGIINSQEAFLQSIAGLCNLDYKPTRELEPNSLSVYLLRNNGRVYGAIQNGRHRFYAKEADKPKYLTSTADFTHLWIIEDGRWKLKRVLSYNHRESD